LAIQGFKWSRGDESEADQAAAIADDVAIDRVDDLTFTMSDASDRSDTPAGQRYSAWADRMRAKRQRDQAHIRATQSAPDPLPGYWSEETVIGRPSAIGDEPLADAPEPRQIARCLGVLGLDPGATSEQVALAYRRLAKVHHPDRWAEAGDAVQLLHSEQMLEVNAAYRILRDRLTG
jgi:hypothetical protein